MGKGLESIWGKLIEYKDQVSVFVQTPLMSTPTSGGKNALLLLIQETYTLLLGRMAAQNSSYICCFSIVFN